MRPAFTRFAAIDWSGAKGRRHKGIAIGVCEAGAGAPRLVRPDHVWSRTEVLDWLRDVVAGDEPTLIGMDFSFAPPIHQRGSYLPGENCPASARAFWAFVDAHADDEDLGAASFLDRSFRRHFYLGAVDGRKADYMHFRACELAFNAAGGGKPSTVYDAIGAAQVAKASFAGMRLLHHLGSALPVWPFDPLPAEGGVLVEIYCRAFIRMTGRRGLKIRDGAELNAALSALGSAPYSVGRPLTDHDTDVLIAAAGLRRIADDPRYWSPPGLTLELAHTEGWTFGV